MKTNRENRFANFIQGFSSVLSTVGSRREYVTPNRNGFIEDAQNMSGDYKVVAANLRRATVDVENRYKAQ